MKIWFRVNCNPRCSWDIVARYIYHALYSEEPLAMWDDAETAELWWGDPVDWVWSNRDVALRIGMCVSEARSLSARDRGAILRNVSRCDMLIVPSEHSATAYRESPIDIPIYVVPFGIDPIEFPYIERDWDGRLKFLHMGRTQFRKGSWMVPEAFIRAFEKERDVQLTIACMDTETPMYQQLKSEYGSHKRIQFSAGYKESAMAYYRNNHVLVSPHLAEGWGLCIPEALATGMTALIARCSAPLEFFRNDFGWWIEMSEYYAPVSKCLPETGGQWRLPDIDSMVSVMRQAYDNRNTCRDSGLVASETFHNWYKWTDTIDGIRGAINAHLG